MFAKVDIWNLENYCDEIDICLLAKCQASTYNFKGEQYVTVRLLVPCWMLIDGSVCIIL